jgi:DNA (cytosine-5)-methyltransferase 1
VHTIAARVHLHAELADSMLFPMPTHTDLIPATRAALVAAGVPFVIENVPRAPLIAPALLCGTMFGLGAACRDEWRQLRRHRLFEWEWSGPALVAPGPCDHGRGSLSVFGNGGGGMRPNRTYLADLAESREALGTPWMTKQGCSQAIPPAFTEWIGAQLRATVRAA